MGVRGGGCWLRVMLLDYEVLPENTSRFHDIFAPRLLHTGAPSDVEEVEHRVLHARLSRSTEGGQFRLAEPHNHHYALMQMHSGQVGFVDSTSPYQSCRSISSAPCLQFRAF